mmetsp:Transcript_49959/g.141185  ORF Transcript_49959/g.141185 Transcript_49959/m.141185 type:complete len:113 (+) Transcript_49959:222-560(+)
MSNQTSGAQGGAGPQPGSHPGLSGAGFGSGYGDLGVQYLARQALMRRQYDFLKNQVQSMRGHVDVTARQQVGGEAYTRVSDVKKEIEARRPPRLSMEEALRRVDAGMGPAGV